MAVVRSFPTSVGALRPVKGRSLAEQSGFAKAVREWSALGVRISAVIDEGAELSRGLTSNLPATPYLGP